MSAGPGVRAAQVRRGALDATHQILESTMADVDDALASRSAPGRANPIGASYAHAVLAEDAAVHSLP
jgi:hypothetical protein